MTISRYLSEHDIKTYWEKFKLNFSEDRVRVWDALLAGLVKYHEILKGILFLALHYLEYHSTYFRSKNHLRGSA